VFAAPLAVNVDKSGKVSGANPQYRPLGGETLTLPEINILRKSFFSTVYPPAMATCCVPDHVFTFYNAAGNYLGDLRLKFGCGCAILSDYAPPHRDRGYIIWDTKAVGGIFEAHHIPVNIPFQ
jgi:hypothetical protein